MHSSHRIVLPIVLASVATVAVVVPGLPRTTVAQAQSSSAAEATSRITAAAQALLAALDDAGRGKVQFPFEGPQKTRWSNLPSGIFQRQGLRLADLTAVANQWRGVRRIEQAVWRPVARAVILVITAASIAGGRQCWQRLTVGGTRRRSGGGRRRRSRVQRWCTAAGGQRQWRQNGNITQQTRWAYPAYQVRQACGVPTLTTA